MLTLLLYYDNIRPVNYSNFCIIDIYAQWGAKVMEYIITIKLYSYFMKSLTGIHPNVYSF